MSTNPGRIDKYELQERLGQGGAGEVWKAFDTEAHHYVAIKLLRADLQADPGFLAHFQREAQIIASLHHPNILQYYDFSISQLPGMRGPTAYMVMEYVEGGTMASYIRNTASQGKFLPAPEIVRLFTPIAMAVDYAHQHSVVHGNLKPANILLDKRNTSSNPAGEPIVTDFGMARLLGGTASGTSGWWMTTPLYISPEQVMGSPADPRSDIYALGIILYEMCTRTPPFQGSNPATIMMQQVNTMPPSPMLINPGLPPAFTTVIMRSIAKDPALRFPTVASLIAALAQAAGQAEKEASNLPISQKMGEAASSVNPMDMPTVLSTKQSPLPAGMTPSPSAPSLPGISGASHPSFPAQVAISGSGGQATPPYYSPPFQAGGGTSQPYPAVQSGGPATPRSPAFTPALSAGQEGWAATRVTPTSPHPFPASAPGKPRRRGLLIALLALLILVLLGSSLGAFFLFFAKSAPPAAPPIVGHAYFASSGLLSPDSRQGITDQLQIHLENLPAPQAGKSYYAWLLNDKTLDFRAIFLGSLTINHGTADLFFPGDASHSNLLATNSRFLITEEDAAVTPTTPSLDPNTWSYYAEFSQQKPNPADPKSYSVYDHIRHLLADDPKVKAAGLTGGLDIWLYRNTQKILEWAGSARDTWKYKDAGSAAFIHRQLTRIIDYLDGATYAQRDLPGQNLLVDPTIAKIGLLTFDPQTQDPPGYLYHISKHLHEITLLPQITAGQKALASQINQAINVVNLWFQTIRDNVLKLYTMPDAQLFGSDGLALLDTVATLANTAFVGQVNPHDQVTAGVVQIHYDIQRLATFDVRACTASNPCAL